MLYLREIIAFLQLTILPGWLFLHFFKPGFGKLRSLLLIPGISLLINYIFTALARFSGVFNTPVCVSYAILCLIAFLCFSLRDRDSFLRMSVNSTADAAGKFFTALKNLFSGTEKENRFFLFLSFAGATAGVGYFLLWAADGADNIFAYWDSALSWNTWAQSWAAGKLPSEIAEYPQAVPMNWALAYLIIGDTIQFVPKFAISCYPLFMALLFFEYGIARKKNAILLAIPIFAIYIRHVDYIHHGGELDLLMAYLPVSLFFILLECREARNAAELWKKLFIALLFACTACAVKQAGFYLLVILPAAVAILLKERFAALAISRRQIIFAGIITLITALLLITPAYAVSLLLAFSNQHVSNIPLVTGSIYGGKSYPERFICSLRLFFFQLQNGDHVASARWEVLPDANIFRQIFYLYQDHLYRGIAAIAGNLLLLIFAWKRRDLRPLITFTLLYFVIWSIFFCYDLRNLSPAIPFLALIAAAGAEEISKSAAGKKILSGNILTALIILTAVYGICNNKFNSGLRRFEHSRLKINKIGDNETNQALQKFITENGTSRKIIHNYYYLRLFPEFAPVSELIELSLDHDEIYQSYLAAMKKDHAGILIDNFGTAERYRQDIEVRVKNGELEKKFSNRNFTFYVKIRQE